MKFLFNMASTTEDLVKGFDKAGITEAIQSANDISRRCENPFAERRQMET